MSYYDEIRKTTLANMKKQDRDEEKLIKLIIEDAKSAIALSAGIGNTYCSVEYLESSTGNARMKFEFFRDGIKNMLRVKRRILTEIGGEFSVSHDTSARFSDLKGYSSASKYIIKITWSV